MKKKIIGIISIVVIILGISVFATSEDPVISLSYLNDVFSPKIDAKIKTATVFEVVNIKKGSTFIGGAGCEFILRGGNGTINASQNGGITDTTSGVDLKQNEALPANHLLIIPRDDGRGFVATADAVIMVKGSYSIK